MDITPRKRAKIVTLRDHTTMSQRKIAESVGVSLGSVSSILKQKRETGKVEVVEGKEKLLNVMIWPFCATAK